MNAWFLLLPMLIIRFGVLSVLGGTASSRAAHIPPAIKEDKLIYWSYQCATAGFLISPFLLKIKVEPIWLFYLGILIYIVGLLLLLLSVLSFARPSNTGINQSGIYRLSRNPMYVSYYLFLIGCGLLTKFFILLVITVIFILTSHRLILAEEQWCKESFGDEYLKYMTRTRRYL